VSTGAAELLHEPSGEGLGPDAGDLEVAARSPFQLFWRRLREDRVAMAALAVVVLLVLVAVLAPLIVKLFGAPKPNVTDSSALDEFGTGLGPSADHPFGTETGTGRDIFSRVVYGARVSLEVAVVATGLSVLIGTVAGLLAGYYRGWVDTLLSRSMDVLLSFPILLLAFGLAAACSNKEGCAGGTIKPGLGLVIAVIAFANWPYIARLVRGQVLSLREKEFVEAARSLGASDGRIMFREILPNLVAPLIVYASLVIPANILFEAALSFLGVGVQEPDPSWGKMIADAISVFDTDWWYMLFPGLALLITVLAFNLLGDGLQDALNPRTAK
jgi:ABC-type dipeptide/oligopeptide/nickel transport system permease subunit